MIKNKMEKFFWADQIADRIIKEKGKKDVYVCASGITPSGIIHIGGFREIITTDVVVKSLEKRGKKVKFIYSWDDFDRFRKVPVNISKDYEKYIGMPLSEIPSPKGKGSYAEYFEKELENSLKKFGIKPKFIYQNLMNKKQKYAKLIKKALDNREEIIEILNQYRKEPLKEDWMPVAIYCKKCKKDSTKIISVKGYKIEYECSCGNNEEIDFSKEGWISVKWRVDWPMRWFYEKVDFEPGGIDHSVEGGSYTTAKEISKAIFNFEPPIYQFYEWIRPKGGTEFASSTGNALSLDDVGEIYQSEVLRYLFVGTRPNKGFQISFDNDVIKIYEDFDKLENKYYEKLTNNQEKRMYELSMIKVPKTKPERTSFRHLITLIQTGKTSGLSKEDKVRVEKVKNWVENYAGDDMKFEVQDKFNTKLTPKQKEAMISLKEALVEKKLSEDKLFNEFYEICSAVGIEGKEFFETAYIIIIGKRKGPRLASLILTIGKDKIIKLLNQIK